MRRYVPKTYYNRRLLRIVFRSIVSVAFALLILFIVFFFALQNYKVTNEDGSISLVIPWLMDEPPAPSDSPTDSPSDSPTDSPTDSTSDSTSDPE